MKFPPERICAMIGSCQNLPMRIMFERKHESNGKEVLCDGCKIFVNAIHAWATCESTTNLIDSLFDKMCLIFNNTDFQPVCEDIVNYGVDKVIKFVFDELPAEKVCAFVKACPATEQDLKDEKEALKSYEENPYMHILPLLPFPTRIGNLPLNVPNPRIPAPKMANFAPQRHNIGRHHYQRRH